MSCPFGYRSKDPEDDHADDGAADVSEPEEDTRRWQPPKDGPRFDAQRDPATWFFQNQIRCEEEFQKNKAKLREEARRQLDTVFSKKNKRLVVDSDDSFSIDSDELSAWDSDVHSLSSMVSCANSYIEEKNYEMGGEWTLKLGLVALAAAAAYGGWRSARAMALVSQYWGVVAHGWAPLASLVCALLAGGLACSCWLTLGAKSKRLLMWFQIGMQVLYAATVGLALVALIYPAQVDLQIKGSACARMSLNDATSKLCRFIPDIEAQISKHMTAIMQADAAMAAALLGLLVSSSWYVWDLGVVAQKALKHKRRRRIRKKSIPWDKIKVEDITPISMCGGGPLPAGLLTKGSKQAAAAEPAKAGGGGGCPFGYRAAAPAAASPNKKDN